MNHSCFMEFATAPLPDTLYLSCQMVGLLEVVFTGVLFALQLGTTTLGCDITISMQRDAIGLFFHKP